MSDITNELNRLFPSGPRELDFPLSEEFPAEDLEMYATYPEEVRILGDFLVYEDAWNHADVFDMYGVCTIIEANGSEGTFGGFKEDPAYPFKNVIMIGTDTFYDAKGEIGEPGSIHSAIGLDLDGATKIADSLLDLLRASAAV